MPNLTPEPVLKRKLKLNGDLRLTPAYELGHDRHGWWLYTPAGTLHRGESGNEVGWCEAAQDSAGQGRPAVTLIPDDGWWVADWIGTPGGVECAIDLATPAMRTTAGWSFADLELDPHRDAYGTVVVDVWDEFEAAVEAGHISEPDAAIARRQVHDLVRALETRTEPFGAVGPTVLAEAVATRWPPIRDRDRIMWPR